MAIDPGVGELSLLRLRLLLTQVAGLVVVSCFFVLHVVDRPRPVVAAPDAPVVDVRTGRLALLGPDGSERAVMVVDRGEVSLSLYSDGRNVVTVASSPSGVGSLAIFGRDGSPRVVARGGAMNGEVAVMAPDGKESIAIKYLDAAGRPSLSVDGRPVELPAR